MFRTILFHLVRVPFLEYVNHIYRIEANSAVLLSPIRNCRLVAVLRYINTAEQRIRCLHVAKKDEAAFALSSPEMLCVRKTLANEEDKTHDCLS